MKLVAHELRQFSLDDGLNPPVPPWNEAWDFTMRWQPLDLATRAGNWDAYVLDMLPPEIAGDPEAWTRMCADFPELCGQEAVPRPTVAEHCMAGTPMQPGTSEIMGRELHGPCLWTLA
ncbi:MAG: hypothetical protein OXE17_03075 [Chloroflexi bacterium]|nr:hypothetical protein [Chloroflexota bacterium]